jgi:asparaginyl-tRNA synthetase
MVMSSGPMKSTPIKQALNDVSLIGQMVEVRGWVKTRRDSKAGMSFVQLNDGSCFANIQLVADNTLSNYQSEVLQMSAGASVIARGTLVASQGGGQKVEIQVQSISLIGGIEDPESYPIQPKAHSYEFLRTVAHLRPRTNTFGAVTRVRHHLMQAIHRYFHEHGYYWVNTPIITASDCEGAGQLFRVSTLDAMNLPRTPTGKVDYAKDFFGKEAFLTVSGQLAVEPYCLALSKVYTFGPTFRAENSNTARHLAEFWMIEPELAFADINDDADLAESLLKYVFNSVLNECGEDLAFFADKIEKTAISRLEQFVAKPFVRLSYSEAVDILKASKKRFEHAIDWGMDLQTEHERFLSEEHVGLPVVVMHYPEKIKSFYMRLNDDGRTVAAMDVLAPGIGEIIGGSQREERLDVLDQRIRAFGLEPEQYSWYRDLRRYGSVPHCGFGLGFERLVAYVTGMANVRDVIPYPRTPGSAAY